MREPADQGSADVSDEEQDDGIRARLYTRWQQPPAEWLTPDRLAKRRLADAMRDVIEQLDSTSAALDVVEEGAAALERVAEEFRHEPKEGFDDYRESANAGGDPHASCERSPFIGRANPLAPPMTLTEDGDVVRGTAFLGSAYEGPPGCVHGGMVAALFDELLGAVQSLGGTPGMTARLTVNYRSPTPLHTELSLEGRIRDIDGRKIFTEGRLLVGDRLCVEAEGLFLSIDVSKFAALIAERDSRVSGRTTE